jgi:Uma2 family endonuclease
MGERLPKRMTPEEFFEWQARQDKNYELVDGIPVLPIKAMTGATERHDTITVNAILSLGTRLRGKPCRPRTQDKAIRIPNGRIRRPDLLVECGNPAPTSMEADEPRVVMEILSPSTMRYDRFQKLEEYKTHPAIRVILLVDTEAPQITVWRREDAGWDRDEEKGLHAAIELPEIGARLPLSELYEGIEFDDRTLSGTLPAE